MTDIAYVVLSDLHFGATNSVLSDLKPGPENQVREVDPSSPSPVLSALLDAFEILADLNTGPRPTLILAGDILDLALSTDDMAAMVFEQFAKRAFDADKPLFADNVIYLPGNHDHHLWETARERQYVAYLNTVPIDQEIDPAWHTTVMRAVPARPSAPAVESDMLVTLIRRQSSRNVTVQVVYPNLALSDADSPQRCVVVHHGHLTESIYLLMSRLKDLMFPAQRSGNLPRVWEWEAENFAWIDFFWSTLGRSGIVGEDVGLVYAQLASPQCVRLYVNNVVRGLVQQEKAPHFLKTIEAKVVDALVDDLVSRVVTLERGSTGIDLTPKGVDGLLKYLQGPTLDQLKTEFDRLPSDVTFVFGHTHKPFERTYPVPGYLSDVKVFNTGGWVVDTAQPVPVQGGAAVLISTDLDVVSLRVYNQDANHAAVPVWLSGSGPWYDELQVALNFDDLRWLAVSELAAQAVLERNLLSAAYQDCGS